MKKNEREIAAFQELMVRYRFTEPVPAEAKRRFIADNRKILERVLKSVGAFSFLYGVYLGVSFILKKFAAGATLTKIVVSTVTAASLSYGGYYTIVKIAERKYERPVYEQMMQKPDAASDAVKKAGSGPETLDDIRKRFGRLDQLVLYNGTDIRGAILSRGEVYRIYTLRGVIAIPRDKIKVVKPLQQ